MPTVPSGDGNEQDLASSDEVKVFKHEGCEEEGISDSVIAEDKSDLVSISEREKVPAHNFSSISKASSNGRRSPSISNNFVSKFPDFPFDRQNLGIIVSPLPPPNGTFGAAVSMGGKVSAAMVGGPQHPGSPLPFMMYTPDPTAHHHHHHSPAFQPPPAHMGISRPPMYPLPPPGHATYPIFPADYAQFQWSSLYPFRGPYHTTLPVSSASLTLSRFPSPGIFPHSLLPHPTSLPHHNNAIVTPGPKQEIPHFPPSTSTHSHRLHSYSSSSPGSHHINHDNDHEINNSHVNGESKKQQKATHIKKPLNAFMLYMKEMRSQVVAECTLKESAAINQILGRRWHALDRTEQSKYYEMARKARQLHMQLYPGWSARDNYTGLGKKKKKKKDKNADGNNPKKCRARFGLDQQDSWCKPCRRKKKCIRYTDAGDINESEDNLGSTSGSIGEAPTPDSSRGYVSDQDVISIDTPSSSSSMSSRTVNGALSLNPHDINNPLSVSQLTQSHRSSGSQHSLNALSPTLSSISLPSPMTDPPSVPSTIPSIVSVT